METRNQQLKTEPQHLKILLQHKKPSFKTSHNRKPFSCPRRRDLLGPTQKGSLRLHHPGRPLFSTRIVLNRRIKSHPKTIASTGQLAV